jgi:Major tropism determinant N-terminal domain
MANRIQLRRDTAANWTRVNPVLEDGEPGLEIDTNKIKYGDGNSYWTDLPYASGGSGLTYVNNLAVLTGNLQIGTLWPGEADQESVIWATEESEYVGLWYGGNLDVVNGNYGPRVSITAGYLGSDDGVYIQHVDSYSNEGYQVNIDVGYNKWRFDDQGTLTLPYVYGIPTAISLNSGSYTSYTTGNAIPTDSGGSPGAGYGMTVDIVADGGGNVLSAVINQPGFGYSVNDVVYINQSGSLDDASVTVVSVTDYNGTITFPGVANVTAVGNTAITVEVGPSFWGFDSSGNLTLPLGGTINWYGGSNALVGGGGGGAAVTVGSFGSDIGIGPNYALFNPALLYSADDMVIRTGGNSLEPGYGQMAIASSETVNIGVANNLATTDSVNGVDWYSQIAFSNPNDGDTTVNVVIGSNVWSFDGSGYLYVPGEIVIYSDNRHGGDGYSGFLTFTNTQVGTTNPNKFIRLDQYGELQIVDSNYANTILALSDTGNLTVKGEIHSSAGAGNVVIQANDGSNPRNFTFDTAGALILPNLALGGQGNGSLDSKNNIINLNIGDTVDFAGFSGMIMVNSYYGGCVTLWLCGGGVTPNSLGNSKSFDCGTMAYNSGISGYTFTANETGNHAFFAIRTRDNP